MIINNRNQTTKNFIATHLFRRSSVFIVPLVEDPLEAFDISNHGTFIFESRSPDQTSVTKDPNAFHVDEFLSSFNSTKISTNESVLKHQIIIYLSVSEVNRLQFHKFTLTRWNVTAQLDVIPFQLHRRHLSPMAIYWPATFRKM